MKISKRVQNIEPSKSIQLAAQVASLKDQGIDVISLSVGETEFKTPEEIITATKNALDQNQTRYSLVSGINDLRDKIAQRFSSKAGIQISKENIIVGNGSKHILYNVFQSLLDEGDEVLVPTPYWVTFPESIKLAGGVPKFVESKSSGQLDLEKIEQSISSKTKAIIINSPNNPSGAVFSKNDLLELGKIAIKNDLVIISDEAYETLVYGDNKHIYVASLSPELFERTLTVQSFSKTFCMTGFRVGYLIGPKKFIESVNKFQGHLSGNNCTFAQFGALAALGICEEKNNDFIKIMERRRNLAYELFSDLFECTPPQGAFYLFPSVTKYLDRFDNCIHMASEILKHTHVAVLPGSAFGVENHLRISFATSEEHIKEAYERMKGFLK